MNEKENISSIIFVKKSIHQQTLSLLFPIELCINKIYGINIQCFDMWRRISTLEYPNKYLNRTWFVPTPLNNCFQ